MNGKEMSGRETATKNVHANSGQAQVSQPRAQVEPAGLGKKRFPFGWLLPVAALSFFLGHFWSYIPSFRGIVSLFVFSKFLAGLSGTHLLL